MAPITSICILLIVVLGSIIFQQSRVIRALNTRACIDRISTAHHYASLLKSRDQEITHVRASYEGMVEAYCRDNGKVYIRPSSPPEVFRPPEPSAFRNRPMVGPPLSARVPSPEAQARMNTHVSPVEE